MQVLFTSQPQLSPQPAQTITWDAGKHVASIRAFPPHLTDPPTSFGVYLNENERKGFHNPMGDPVTTRSTDGPLDLIAVPSESTSLTRAQSTIPIARPPRRPVTLAHMLPHKRKHREEGRFKSNECDGRSRKFERDYTQRRKRCRRGLSLHWRGEADLVRGRTKARWNSVRTRHQDK